MQVCLSGIEHSRRNVMFLPRLHHKRVDSFSLWLFSLAQSDEASCHVVAEAHRLRNSCGCECVKIILATKEWTWNAFFSAEPWYDCSHGFTPMATCERSSVRDPQPIHACIPSPQSWLCLAPFGQQNVWFWSCVLGGGRGRYILKNLVKASKAIKTARYSSVGVRSSLEKNIAH